MAFNIGPKLTKNEMKRLQELSALQVQDQIQHTVNLDVWGTQPVTYNEQEFVNDGKGGGSIQVTRVTRPVKDAYLSEDAQTQGIIPQRPEQTNDNVKQAFQLDPQQAVQDVTLLNKLSQLPVQQRKQIFKSLNTAAKQQIKTYIKTNKLGKKHPLNNLGGNRVTPQSLQTIKNTARTAIELNQQQLNVQGDQLIQQIGGNAYNGGRRRNASANIPKPQEFKNQNKIKNIKNAKHEFFKNAMQGQNEINDQQKEIVEPPKDKKKEITDQRRGAINVNRDDFNNM